MTRVLYLTDNPTLGGTIRILQGWLLLGRKSGDVAGYVAIPPGSEFRRWLEAHDVPYVHDPLPVPDRRWPVPALRHGLRLARWVKREAMQVIHCNEHNVYPFGALLRRLTRLPLVCHVRYRVGRDYCEWAFGGRRGLPDALLWTSRQQRADCADAIQGIVPDDRQHLIPLGLDLSVFGAAASDRATTRRSWGFAADAVIIGQACALRPRKRIEDFVDLVARLASEDSRVVGVLAGDAPPGDEPYRARVLDYIARSGLGPRFRWLGNLDDVEPFDHGIDIFVSTSEYETFGNSVCEAMACGQPIVAYRGGSVGEVVGDAGAIVPTCNVEALVAAARPFVADAGLRSETGKLGRNRVDQEFSPAASLAKLVRIYEQLVTTT